MMTPDPSNGLENTQADQILEQWHNEIFEYNVNLIGDYAGNELFLIEGDSLLRHCFADSTLDFQGGRTITAILVLS
jgi:hypothetical protein